MKRHYQRLFGVLILQLVFSLGLYGYYRDQSGTSPTSLVSTELAVNKIVIESHTGIENNANGPDSHSDNNEADGQNNQGKQKEEITLRLAQTQHPDQAHWQLPQYHHLPVDQRLIDHALQQLQSLKAGWPVSDSHDSHRRFDLTDDTYQRRIRLYHDEKLLGDLLLGMSPGYRQLYLRPAGSDQVYRVKLNHHDFPVDADHWLDKKLLAQKDLLEITTDRFSLEKQQGYWQLTKGQIAALDENALQNQAEQFAEQLSGLTVEGLSASLPSTSPAYTLELSAEGQNPMQLALFEQDKRYYLKTEQADYGFQLSETNYRQLVDLIQWHPQKLSATDKDMTQNKPAETVKKST